jgi:hypothetical protein
MTRLFRAIAKATAAARLARIVRMALKEKARFEKWAADHGQNFV